MTYVRTDGYGNVRSWPVTPEQKANSGLPDRFFEPVKARAPMDFNPRLEAADEIMPERINGLFHQAWRVWSKDADMLRKEALERLAALRWEREVGGIEANGMPLSTDRDTQAAISRARQSFDNGDMSAVRWKLGNGQWITIGPTQIAAIAGAVTVHVNACFDAESDVSDIIAAAADVSAVAAIDINAEFATAYTAAMTAAMS